jgi:hypothetical protein
MRLPSMLAALALGVLGAVGQTAPAAAWGWDPSVAPEGYDHPRVIRHYVYRPRYQHVYHSGNQGDPYAYRYAKRAYYPYSASHYWAPAEMMRNRYRYSYDGPKYRYQPSWGKPVEHHSQAGHPAPSRPVK